MLKFRKRAALIAATVLCVVGLAGCAPKNDQVVTNAYPDEDYGFQMEMPKAGDTVAIMHTSMGDICLRLFPDAAPLAVENFITHANDGYYNGVTFHRVIEGFMIQGGDPKGDGTGGSEQRSEERRVGKECD